MSADYSIIAFTYVPPPPPAEEPAAAGDGAETTNAANAEEEGDGSVEQAWNKVKALELHF